MYDMPPLRDNCKQQTILSTAVFPDLLALPYLTLSMNVLYFKTERVTSEQRPGWSKEWDMSPSRERTFYTERTHVFLAFFVEQQIHCVARAGWAKRRKLGDKSERRS